MSRNGIRTLGIAAAVAAVAAVEVVVGGAGSFVSTNPQSAPGGVMFGQAAPAVPEGLAFLGFGIVVTSLAANRRRRNRLGRRRGHQP